MLARRLFLFVPIALLGMACNVFAQPTDSLVPAKRYVGVVKPNGGEVIDGVWISNPSGPCVIIRSGIENVTIQNSRIGPCGAKSPEDYGVFIAENASNITIKNNVIYGVSTGVRATRAKSPIIVEKNLFHSIRGPLWSGQAVQFNQVYGGSRSSKISCNVSDATYGSSPRHYEDHISMYNSAGTSSSPIIVEGNRIRGGNSKSGGGITVGDKGGAWITVRDNIVVRVANSGIGVAGGSNIRVERNIVDNRGDGPEALTHMAMYVRALSQCSDITLTGNRAIARLWTWGESDGRLVSGYRHGPQMCANVNDANNFFGDQSIPANIFDQTPSVCGQ